MINEGFVPLLIWILVFRWIAVVTPTDRFKLVRNHCVIEVLVAFCVFNCFGLHFMLE